MAVKRNQDFMPFDASEYRAVINPTNLTVQAWAYGRRLVLQPGNLTDKKRACIQFVRTRLALKAVKNKRKLLEIMTVEQGLKLLETAKEMGNFHSAYRKVTGRTVSKVGELLAEQQEKTALTRALIANTGIGPEMLKTWTVSDMRAVLKDPTLAMDIDPASGRPRVQAEAQGSLFEVAARAAAKPKQFRDYLQEDDRATVRDGSVRMDASGVEGDFVDPSTIGDDFVLPEEAASQATFEYDVANPGAVKGPVPAEVAAQRAAFKGIERVVSQKDLSEPLPEPAPLEAMRSGAQAAADEAAAIKSLRAQIEALGGSYHGRAGSAKLQETLDELIKSQTN